MSDIDNQIIELLNIGISPYGIAEILNFPDVLARVEIMKQNGVKIPNYSRQRDIIASQYNLQPNLPGDSNYNAIIELLKNGKTVLEIANLIGKAPSTVNKMISQMIKLSYSVPRISADQKYSPPARPSSKKLAKAIIDGLNAGMSQIQIAEMLEISPQAVSRRILHMRKNGQQLPDINEKVDKLILECRKNGHTLKEIATTLKTTPNHILYRLKVMKKNGINTSKSSYDDDILKYLNQGNAPKEIAGILDLAPQSVNRRIRLMKERGTQIPDRRIYNDINTQILQGLSQGMSKSEIAKILHISPTTVTRRINVMITSGIKIPHTDVHDLILAQYFKGTPKPQIAINLGIHPSTINRNIQKMIQDSHKDFSRYLFELTKTRNATPNQLAIIAQYYGIDIAHLSPDLKPIEMER